MLGIVIAKGMEEDEEAKDITEKKKTGLELLGGWDGANRQTSFGVILRPT